MEEGEFYAIETFGSTGMLVFVASTDWRKYRSATMCHHE
jgi:hypothetical protein